MSGIYKATVRGVEVLAVGPTPFSGRIVYLTEDEGCTYFPDEVVTDLRPLVVLDPESDEDVSRMADALGTPGSFIVAGHILRALAAPPAPKPVEPTGLGAVAHGRDGRCYVRARSDSDNDCNWVLVDSVTRGEGWVYVSFGMVVDADEILSHGYLCTCGADDCPGGAA